MDIGIIIKGLQYDKKVLTELNYESLEYIDAAIEALAKLGSMESELLGLIPDCRYMDPPDGGNVTVIEQIKRMIADKPAVAVPDEWRIVEKKTCYALLRGNEVIATLAGPDAEKNAAVISSILKAAPSHSQQSKPAVAVPDGWKLVPIEPTTQQIYAAETPIDAVVSCRQSSQHAIAEGAYRSMLAAAPSHSQQSDGHDWDDQDKCKKCGDRDWYAGPVCNGKSAQSADRCPSQQSYQSVPLPTVMDLRAYMDEFGKDSDLDVIKSELGEMILRANGTYGRSPSHESEQGGAV